MRTTLSVLAGFVLLASACSGSSDKPESVPEPDIEASLTTGTGVVDGEILIGVVGDLSSESSGPGQAYVKGLNTKLAELDADGGVGSIKLASSGQDVELSFKVLELDSEGDDLTQTQRAIEANETSEVALLVGYSDSELAILSSVGRSTGTLVVGPLNTSGAYGVICGSKKFELVIEQDASEVDGVDGALTDSVDSSANVGALEAGRELATSLDGIIEFAITSGEISRASIFASAQELAGC